MQAILAAVAAHAVTTAPPPYGFLPPPTSSARLFRFTLLAEQPLHISLFQSSAAAAAPSPLAAYAAAAAAAAPRTVGASAATHSPIAASAATKKAVAVLKGNSQVQGVVTLLQENNGPTTVKVRVTGLAPGPHGFHLHEYGDVTNGCISTGAHFNPNKLTHGAPEDNIRHAGDLGNIFANSDGVAEATIIDSQGVIPLSGPTAVIGRSFVVHEFEDDLGKGGKELSLSTGNAGGRLACGIVGLTPVSVIR